MSLSSIFTLCSVLLCFVGVHSKEDLYLPAPLKVCKQDADDFASCLRLAFQESWPTIVNGIPEYNIPKLDPLEIPYQESVYGNGDIRGKVQLKNARIYGLSKMKFLSINPTIDGDKFRIEIDAQMPKVFYEGEYKLDGSLGAYKLGGRGHFNASAEGIRTTFDFEGVVKNDRLIIQHFRNEPEISKLRVWFDGLFDGNDELNRAAVAFVNDNWRLMYKATLPYVAQTTDIMMAQTMNPILAKISFSTLFPVSKNAQ